MTFSLIYRATSTEWTQCTQ